MLHFVSSRAFSFKVEDLFGVGSIIGQAKIKRMKPMTTIPMGGLFFHCVIIYQ